VTGWEGSLDIHHITLRRRPEDHRSSNLIALSPNCHRDAHDGILAQKTLREFRRLPWVHRPEEKVGSRRMEVFVYLQTGAGKYGGLFLRMLRMKVAALLDIRPEYVETLKVEPVNGVRITIRLPIQSARRLLDLYEDEHPTIEKRLGRVRGIYRRF
jgi:hypothetical protein